MPSRHPLRPRATRHALAASPSGVPRWPTPPLTTRACRLHLLPRARRPQVDFIAEKARHAFIEKQKALAAEKAKTDSATGPTEDQIRSALAAVFSGAVPTITLPGCGASECGHDHSSE